MKNINKLRKTTDMLKIHTANGELFKRPLKYRKDPAYLRECKLVLDSFHDYGFCFYYNPSYNLPKRSKFYQLGNKFMKSRMIDNIDINHPEVCKKTKTIYGLVT